MTLFFRVLKSTISMSLSATMIFSATVFFSAPVQAGVYYTLDSEQEIARLNDLQISRTVLDMFLQKQQAAAKAHGRALTLQYILQQLLDDKLLADYARKTLTSDELSIVSRVGFNAGVEREQQRVALLRNYYHQDLLAAIQTLPGGDLSSLVTWNAQLDSDRLQQLIGLKNSLTINLTAEQIITAEQTPVLTTTLAEQGVVTLMDIYQRQNVQGRLALQKGDVPYLKQQARYLVGGLYVQQQARQKLTAEEWTALEQILLNQQQRQQLLQTLGVYADIHDDNPALRQRAAQISDQQLNTAYEQHKEDFRVVEKTRVRHIRVTEQAEADRIVSEIRAGLSFADAVKRYSIADDKQQGGNLGWLKRADKKRSWLHSVAFVQPQGQVSAPFRTPQNEGDIAYEILWVDEREDGYLPLTDQGVRYELSHTLAKEALQQQLTELKQSLRRDADIYLNKRLQSL